ncbi:hypothetical protein IF1G_05487 [Cordyceps javanica]|uniref:Uncharacterized protein n=1 Tax=Cordyceps javanica TaxID=43265 RepID=A0A545VZI8_9HYPO|nr:hypothetical protein IF1G_05487 [Cordyceps javanica]TQW07138.1 hypothetical protein IF2G_05522 [Cordyceps javanica]
MDNLSRSIFPLARDVTREQLRSLCQVMWQWELCHDCKAAKDCGTASCPWQQAPNLEAFFQFYREVTASYVPERPMEGTRALSSHDDLIAIISTLKNCSQAHRHVLTRAHFAQRAEARAEQCLPLPIDQDRAFSLAARVLAMVNSSAEHQADGLLESGMLPLTWQDNRSFSDFMETAFPLQGDEKGGRESPRQQLIPDQANKWPKLTAKRLKKMAGLELVATDNLQNHLRLDAKHKTVEIYHYTSVLKENLLSSVHCDSHDDTARGISEGNMPRELALETLATIKEILFPLDADSQALLRTLVSKKSFDPDCLRVDTRPYRRPDDCKGAGAATLPYRYWGARLSDLCEHMETPTPSGHLERWMERRSGARHVMMATLGGVVLAVLLGAASLAVSIFQAWVGYQQWQHPVNPS